MFHQLLYVQWKWSRTLLAFFTAVGFALPLIILWYAMPKLGVASARELVQVGEVVGWCCLGLALLAGGSIAAQGYGLDDRAGHIYALSLPITRSRFLATRTLAAFVILALPALAIWIGGGLAASQANLPATLSSYAGSLAVRALLAAWLAHSCVFALRYSAGRRAKVVFFVLLVALLGAGVLARVAPSTRILISRTANFLITHPGPFGVVFGRWTLFDV